MAHPEPRNLDDLYGPGAENADAGVGGPEDRIKAAKETLRRAEYTYESAGDDRTALEAMVDLMETCRDLVAVAGDHQRSIQRLEKGLATEVGTRAQQVCALRIERVSSAPSSRRRSEGTDGVEMAIFDLDGTLADCEHRRHFLDPEAHPDMNSDQRHRAFFAACPNDRPNVRLMRVADILSAFCRIVIFSARSDEVRKETEEWLRCHQVHYDELRMRPAGDFTPDEELKKRWLDEMDRSRILLVFDDRQAVVDMWRSEGLLCCQVARGNF